MDNQPNTPQPNNRQQPLESPQTPPQQSYQPPANDVPQTPPTNATFSSPLPSTQSISQSPATNKTKNLIIIGIVVFALLITGVGVYLFFAKSQPQKSVNATSSQVVLQPQAIELDQEAPFSDKTTLTSTFSPQPLDASDSTKHTAQLSSGATLRTYNIDSTAIYNLYKKNSDRTHYLSGAISRINYEPEATGPVSITRNGIVTAKTGDGKKTIEFVRYDYAFTTKDGPQKVTILMRVSATRGVYLVYAAPAAKWSDSEVKKLIDGLKVEKTI